MQQTVEFNHSRKREDLQNCRLIEAICFAVFLPVAMLASIGGWRWHPWPPGPEGYGSVIDEARSMARTVAEISVSV